MNHPIIPTQPEVYGDRWVLTRSAARLYTSKGLIALFVILLTLFTAPTGAAKANPLPVAQPGSKISTEVLEAMKSLPAGEMLTVIVTLNDQVTRSQLAAIPPAANRADRLKHVIDQLQSKADVSQRALKSLLTRRQAEGQAGPVEYLWIMNGLAVTATPAVILELAARPEVKAISANETIQAPLPPEPELGRLAAPEANLQNINTPAMWDMGYTGQGVVVANLDTGVDLASHPDLAATWRGGSNSWFDPYGQNPTPKDFSGHGTWTMGVMVGGENNGSAYGVAPGAQWIAAKIFDNSGYASVLAIHRALQWVLDPDGDPTTPDAPHVVNNSWTWAPGCNYQFRTAVQNLRAAGILPIFAAGNNPSVSHSPANYPEAFAVGAVDNADIVYSDSSRGPSACDTTTYPEIAAPGVNIYTADLHGLYLPYTGTSLAAPHVAGALALLLSAAPELTVDEQEAALLNGVVDLGAAGPDNTYGYGRLDLLGSLYTLGELDISVTQTVKPNLAIVDKPLQLTLSIVNSGPGDASDVTLTHTSSNGVTMGRVATSQGSCSTVGSNSIGCALGDMPAKSPVVTVTIVMTPTTSGITLTNTTLVSAVEMDFNARNNNIGLTAPVLAELPFKVMLPLLIR